MNHKIPRAEFEDSLLRLKRSASRWRSAAAVAGLAFAALAGWNGYQWVNANYAEDLGWAEIDSSAPFAAQLKKVIAPLRYSGLEPLLHEDVSISVDPRGMTWVLHNIRTYDADGRTTLDEGRYGICGELASYAYWKVRDVVGRGYGVQVVRAAESAYFPSGTSDHFLLLITDLRDPKKVYALDPSFHRYGPIERFKDYAFFASAKAFMLNRNPDMRQTARQGLPLIIRRKQLVLLSVEPNAKGLFDAENQALKLTLFRKNEYRGTVVLDFDRENGAVTETENAARLKSILGDDDYKLLRSRLTSLFAGIPANSRPTKR